MHPRLLLLLPAAIAAAACAGLAPGGTRTLAPATPAVLQGCEALAGAALPGTTIGSAARVPAGTLSVGGAPIAEHCLVTGRMAERVSPVDGQTYAIGFQMRLPQQWNGRFFHQANGGLDGVVQPALGSIGGAGGTRNALHMGFAVLSSDAGHNAAQNPLFGLDPQARLDYGYQAVVTLTPMAKALIRAAYAKAPDRSYIGGCSNGGRHVMVAAARLPGEYDGYLAGNPGFNLPKAAVAQLYGAQQYAAIAGEADLGTAFTPAERALVAGRVLAQCDALDGAADGLIQDTTACQQRFRLERDVPTCAADGRTGQCLTPAQKVMIANVFGGARNRAGQPLYASFPYDAGITSADWAGWEFSHSISTRDPVALAFVFQSPPAGREALSATRAFALAFDMDRDAPKIRATSAPYAVSSMDFMTPPQPTDLSRLKARGARMIVYHGTSDAVFSSDDTTAWFEAAARAGGGDASDVVRLFRVPGMAHCGGGPSTDAFDALGALVAWVERGEAPAQIVAKARGPGHAGAPNPEVPAHWAPDRTRPLCPYPQVARYQGGDVDQAASFRCR
jgi:feruloyl esterase